MLGREGARIAVICNQGYQSSLAAATVASFGLREATDVMGFQAWRAAGLPVEPYQP
jgi:rhodanese-related sulfurtransferase